MCITVFSENLLIHLVKVYKPFWQSKTFIVMVPFIQVYLFLLKSVNTSNISLHFSLSEKHITARYLYLYPKIPNKIAISYENIHNKLLLLCFSWMESYVQNKKIRRKLVNVNLITEFLIERYAKKCIWFHGVYWLWFYGNELKKSFVCYDNWVYYLFVEKHSFR